MTLFLKKIYLCSFNFSWKCIFDHVWFSSSSSWFQSVPPDLDLRHLCGRPYPTSLWGRGRAQPVHRGDAKSGLRRRGSTLLPQLLDGESNDGRVYEDHDRVLVREPPLETHGVESQKDACEPGGQERERRLKRQCRENRRKIIIYTIIKYLITTKYSLRSVIASKRWRAQKYEGCIIIDINNNQSRWNSFVCDVWPQFFISWRSYKSKQARRRQFLILKNQKFRRWSAWFDLYFTAAIILKKTDF